MSSDDRKLRILDRVRPLFSRKGLKVTSRELAEAAGVSEALIYKLFSSKEELFKALLSECHNNYAEVAQELADSGESGSEVLVCATYILVHAYVYGVQSTTQELAMTAEETRGLLLHSFQNDGEFARNMFSQGLGPWVKYFLMSMEVAEQAGELEPSPVPYERLVWYAHHMCLGVKVTHHPDPDASMMPPISDEKLSEDLMHFSLRGLGLKQSIIDRTMQSQEFKKFKQKLATKRSAL